MPPKAAPPAKAKAPAPAAKGAAKAPAKAAAPAAKAGAKDAGKGAKAADPKAKDAKGAKADPKAKAAGKADAKGAAPAKGDGKAFPLEKGPTPSKMEPTDITRLYKLPDGDMKTEEDVITKQGYSLEEQVEIVLFFVCLQILITGSNSSKQLGKGGFGTVFLARDKKKNIKVACKLCELGKEWSDARVKDMKNVSVWSFPFF